MCGEQGILFYSECIVNSVDLYCRLPSIGKPRDLTLGGVPKKVFTPTIPARRDKSAEK